MKKSREVFIFDLETEPEAYAKISWFKNMIMLYFKHG